MSDLILNLWKWSGIYTWNRWQKANDDDVPLQLKTRVVSHRVAQALVLVVGYNISRQNLRCCFTFPLNFYILQPWDLLVNARFVMLVSVSRCSSPSTLFLVSITCTCSSSASFYRSWFLDVDARIAILISVEGCSIPNTLLLVSIICTSSSSVSFHRFWWMYIDASLAMLISVSRCFSPSTLFLVFITCTSSSSASFHR